jgi:hypothetical protein
MLGDVRAPMTSSPDMGIAAEVGSLVPSAPGLAPKQKVMLAVGAPLLVAMIIAFAILAGGRSNEVRPTQAARPLRDAAAPAKSAPESPPLVAPVVIAPPENDDVGDAGTPGEVASAGARGQARGKKPLVRDDDPYALLMQDGGPAKARRVLEDRGVDKLNSDELRVLRSICRAQKDAACLSRVAVQMDRHP